jgi:hypothetical protein
VVRNPEGTGSFLVSEPSSPNLGLSQAPSRGVTGFFRGVAKRPERELTTDTHLIMKLRMSGAVLLLTLYTFMVCVWGVCYTLYELKRLTHQVRNILVEIMDEFYWKTLHETND